MIRENPVILAMETSLDETCAAVTVGRRVLSNVVSSQVELHRKYGGVVPIVAKRAHEERINAVLSESIKRATIAAKRNLSVEIEQHVLSKFNRLRDGGKLDVEDMDSIAVTYGPGQALALEVGIDKAKELSKKYDKPLIAVDHMEGHLLAPFAQNSRGRGSAFVEIPECNGGFPLIGLLISGGHTQLVLVKGIGDYKILGETLDDAAGEAFDKVGRMLGLGYPGGPVVEEIAKNGDEDAFNLPVPMEGKGKLNFSYSGIKTAVLYKTRELKKKNSWNRETIQNLAASFQRVMAQSLTIKLEAAVKEYNVNGVLLGGGVISNIYIRRKIRQNMREYGLKVYIPYDDRMFTDNAAMIGISAYFKARRNEFVKNVDSLDRNPNAKLD